MKRDMMEELNTRVHSRGMSAALHMALLGMLGRPLPERKPSIKRPAFTRKEWNRRKVRQKMAKQSRKLNRRGA